MRRIFINNIQLGSHLISIENQNYINKITRENSLISKIKLGISSIKKERFEWLVEKATEIGVDEIFILKTARSQINHLNLERIKKIAQSAARQSNRIVIPEIHPEQKLEEFLKNCDKNWAFASLNTQNKEIKNITGIIIGPEGGWSKEEESILTQKSLAITLSHNILRTETAAIISLTKIIGL